MHLTGVYKRYLSACDVGCCCCSCEFLHRVEYESYSKETSFGSSRTLMSPAAVANCTKVLLNSLCFLCLSQLKLLHTWKWSPCWPMVGWSVHDWHVWGSIPCKFAPSLNRRTDLERVDILYPGDNTIARKTLRAKDWWVGDTVADILFYTQTA